jgi:hypothetical protein
MSTTHDWESFIACYTTYKNGDDWGMVQMALLYPHEWGLWLIYDS